LTAIDFEPRTFEAWLPQAITDWLSMISGHIMIIHAILQTTTDVPRDKININDIYTVSFSVREAASIIHQYLFLWIITERDIYIYK
jgi:hypothetical protein